MSTDHATEPDRRASDPLLDRLRLATLGSYDVAGELGRGGMAVVYVGRDLRLERTVAIKVMDPRLSLTPGMADRFLQEARIAARLQHPNVIVVHEVHQSDEIIYFVMGLVQGGALDELCQRPGVIPIDQIRWLLLQSARALAYAHDEGIVHRDVKPANILINLQGEIILTDFGIAKAVDGDSLTKSGTSIGTPIYMAPEQFSDQPVGPACDQYALGITAYQLLTGQPPFTGDLYKLIADHGQKTPQPIRELRPDCPPFLASAVMRMLAKKVTDRWPSMDDLVAVLSANMPGNGGEARAALADAARELMTQRRERTPALSAKTPVSPTPINASGARKRNSASRLLSISPPGATIFSGSALTLRATVSLENGQTEPGARVEWSSSETSIATISADGTVVGVSAGTVTVRAQAGDSWSEASVRVEAAPLARLVVAAPVETLLVGDDVRVTATAYDVNGQSRADAPITWESESPDVVRVDAQGRCVALAPGAAAIVATTGGLQRVIEFAVQRRPIALIRIRGDERTMERGEAMALTLETFDDRGTRVTPPAVRWSASPAEVAYVDSAGTALAIGPGHATVTVSVDDATDTFALEVIEPAVASMTLTVSTPDLLVGDEASLTLRVVDALGEERSRTGVRFWSSQPHIVAVREDGQTIVALAAGTADVHATYERTTSTTVIDRLVKVAVRPVVAVRLEATPTVIDARIGSAVPIAVRAYDERGRVMDDVRIAWESDAPEVAIVERLTPDAPPSVQTLAAGSALLRAVVRQSDGHALDLRVPVRVRGVTAPVVLPTAVPPVAPPVAAPVAAPVVPPAVPLPSATALFVGGASPAQSQPAAATAGAPAAAPAPAARAPEPVMEAPPAEAAVRTRSPLLIPVAVVALLGVAIAVWSMRSRTDTTADTLAATPTVAEGPSVSGAGSNPGQAPTPTAVARGGSGATPPEAPPVAPPVAPKAAGSDRAPVNPVQKPAPATTTPPSSKAPVAAPLSPAPVATKGATPANPTPVTTSAAATQDASKKVEAPPVVVDETPVDAPTVNDAQTVAASVLMEMRQTKGGSPDIVTFWKFGAAHAVDLTGAAQIVDEGRGRAQAQFVLRFSKIDAGGQRARFESVVSVELSRSGGRLTRGAMTMSPLKRL